MFSEVEDTVEGAPQLLLISVNLIIRELLAHPDDCKME